ncbi:ImmA/IrrE family metallo-endopeptidase [Lacticaseibacillus nasuensis]|uniref:ImmA/IrrE family metallo-endopeptidase n=1 Tax=Lacticaseibacillus nasuensis TaxID=944671 RepID=UPI0022477639|nr:ImmA/IrrE family metallo-endopeptidase [Lacticaseibacillus nasuensis]MCX2455670.1 ImmA/IrrE family metallo-endopeptidase [Lacticaseibacillus nasuensis]
MNTYLWKLLNWATDHDIAWEVQDSLSPYTPCTSNPSNRRMVINSRYHDPLQLPFQAAHECGHIINGDSGTLYLYTPSKTALEGAASRTGIKILVPLFFDGVDDTDANSQRFVEAFHIPSSMVDWVQDEIVDYYTEAV